MNMSAAFSLRKRRFAAGNPTAPWLLRDGETVKGSILYRLEGRRVILLKLNGDGHTNREGLIRPLLTPGGGRGLLRPSVRVVNGANGPGSSVSYRKERGMQSC